MGWLTTISKDFRTSARFVLLFLLIASAWLVAMGSARAEQGPTVRMVYFYATDCGHCMTVIEELLKPLQSEYGDGMEIKMVEISEPQNYELLIRAEDLFEVSAEERGLPTLIIDGMVMIGEDEIRSQLQCTLDTCLTAGGTSWPDIPGLGEISEEPEVGFTSGFELGADVEPCGPEAAAACEGPAPIRVAYFYQVGCQECSRAEYDLEYARSKVPQLVVEELDVQENAALAEWLAERAGVPEEQRLATPALFVGEDYLIGSEITSDAVLDLVEKYVPTGADRFWADFDAQVARQGIIDRFRSFGALTVVLAGLVDGLNPCAFATLVFFVSYLSISGRKGREILAVGAAFTLGVFLAYLGIGLGLYQVLGMLGDLLTRLGRWVYGLTAVLCAGLAVFSLLDYLKARRGDIGDMSLNLPHKLRMRINAVIRRGRGAQAYVLGSFVTGLIVSILELACTGQVYLPTIIFVTSIPGLRVRGILYLALYNLLFVVPLIVVFVLAYYGTTSKDLTRFLQRNAATVKLGMVLLFASLAVWLGLSLI
ncbi:MAG: cytochrome c biogenesis protein CcdA [Anaerolineae bacterium]|jgi:cytochrome c biogenesis protein CcdA/thiol-disulfide isomerase/thioredoxin